MKETPPWRRTSRDRAGGRRTPSVPHWGQGCATMAPQRPPGVARRRTTVPCALPSPDGHRRPWSAAGRSPPFLNAAGGRRRRHCRPCRRPSQIRPWGAGFGQGDAGFAADRRRRPQAPPRPHAADPARGEAGSGRRDPSFVASPPSKTWLAREGRPAPPPRSGAAARRKALPSPSLWPARRPSQPLWQWQGEAAEREGALAGRGGSPLQSPWPGRPERGKILYVQDAILAADRRHYLDYRSEYERIVWLKCPRILVLAHF
jgi:hypothetical protein